MSPFLSPFSFSFSFSRFLALQLFHDGLFNADCHPGNVLCLSDGRLGLVDYGQAARLAPAQRAALARLTLALADGRVADAARLFRALGYAPGPAGSAAAGGGGGGDGAAFAAAVVAFDRDDRAVTGGLNVQAWLERQARADPGARWPDAFVMASRASFLLRGCGIVLGRPLSVAQAWRPAAEAFLRASGEPMV